MILGFFTVLALVGLCQPELYRNLHNGNRDLLQFKVDPGVLQYGPWIRNPCRPVATGFYRPPIQQGPMLLILVKKVKEGAHTKGPWETFWMLASPRLKLEGSLHGFVAKLKEVQGSECWNGITVDDANPALPNIR